VLTSALGLALGGIGFGLVREARNPRFAVEVIAVHGLVHTTSESVLQAAAFAPNQNAWLINRMATSRRIEALPWVGKAMLHVSWPNRLTIDIAERQALARVMLPTAGDSEDPSTRYAIIDDSERVLMVSGRSGEQAALPMILVTPPPSDNIAPGDQLSSADVAQALVAYQKLRTLGLQVSEVAIAPSTGISATADRNLHVLFGEDEDLAKKAALFQAIVAKISTPERIAYIDVRSVRAPTVLYR
jgi:cell division septal protein FtsQ